LNTGIAIGILFVLFHGILHFGLVMEAYRERHTGLKTGVSGPSDTVAKAKYHPESPASSRTVSVVIPAKNEASRISGLFAALHNQDYPLVEFVFVNDRSTDETGVMLDGFVASLPKGKARVITLTENKGPNYKQNALTQALAQVDSEYILFTDADCTFSSDWISTMVRLLENEKTGIGIGPVFKKVDGPGFFSFYQAFDHIVRYMYLAASTGIGLPAGGFGNNLIIRKAALDKIGGYGTVPYSVTEDAALISCIRTQTDYTVRAALSPSSCIITLPEHSWQELISQGLRWNNGGIFSPDLLTRIGFGILMIAIAAGIILLPFSLFFPFLVPLPLAVLISMSANTLASARIAGTYLPGSRLRLIPCVVFTPAYFSYLTILGYLGVRVRWKGVPLD